MFKSRAEFRHPLIKTVLYLLFVMPGTYATAANPELLCNDMKALTKQAHSNFSAKVANGTSVSATRPQLDADKCTMARSLSGANTYHCAWDFTYRNVDANTAFEAFNQSLQICFGDSAEIAKDQAVNHPDFYEQRRYQMDEAVVTVSIKDKIALQRTYVFIGVQGVKPE